MKKIYTIVILLTLGITQIYAQNCFDCDSTTKVFTIGFNTAASGLASFAGGNTSEASGTYSFTFGDNAKAMGSNGIAFGNNAIANFDDGIAIGSFIQSNAANALVFGTGISLKPLVNSKPNSIMFGVTSLPSLTIVQPPNVNVGYVGIGTDSPTEMVHVMGKLFIERTDQIASSLHFGYSDPYIKTAYRWDIFSDISGLKIEGSGGQNMVITNSGWVGIGVSPKAKLHVNQNILADGNITTLNKFVLSPAYNSTTDYWEISRTNTGLHYAYKGGNLQNVLFIGNDGRIGVGTTTPSTTLDVDGSFKAQSATIANSLTANALNANSANINGKIKAKEVEVTLSGWSDFVFEDDYNLLSLKEVEQYIKQNGRLPEIPSAKEVEENGINLGEMQSKLLQKIEEMTLYILQQDKKITDLQNQINELKKQ